MDIQITLASGVKDLRQLRQALEAQPGFGGSEPQLVIRERKKFRSVDPTLLVAIVGAAGTGLGALITGLFQIRQQVAAKKFILVTGSGQKLELPADTPVEKIDHLLGALKQMDEVKKISVE